VPEKDALDARDLITVSRQVAQCLDHRQAGADRGLVQVIRAALAARQLEALVVGSVPLLAFLFGVTMWMPAASQSR